MSKVEKKCTITFEGCEASWEKYEQLKIVLKETLSEIDKETPWQETEPNWWLEMNDVDRILRGLKVI